MCPILFSPLGRYAPSCLVQYRTHCPRNRVITITYYYYATHNELLFMQTLHSLFSVSCLNSIEFFPTDTKLPAEHIEPLQLSLDVVPSPLEAVKILRVPLCSRLLQGLTTIAMKKNLRQVYMYVLYIHMHTL